MKALYYRYWGIW